MEVEVSLTDTTPFIRLVPILIVPDTKFNGDVPLLIGTNFLRQIPSNQLTALMSSFHPNIKTAISVMLQKAEEIEKSHGNFGSILLSSDVSVPAHSTLYAEGEATIIVPVCQQIALLQGVSEDAPIVPGIVQANQGKNHFSFEIVNGTDHPVSYVKGQILASVHQASISGLNSHVDSQTSDSQKHTYLRQTLTN